jgi:hypothetical protein
MSDLAVIEARLRAVEDELAIRRRMAAYLRSYDEGWVRNRYTPVTATDEGGS